MHEVESGLDVGLDPQTASDGLAVVANYSTSLDAAFDLQTASDSLVVLYSDATSFYVCLDSHLATLLYCILVKFNLSW